MDEYFDFDLDDIGDIPSANYEDPATQCLDKSEHWHLGRSDLVPDTTDSVRAVPDKVEGCSKY